jgi:hypothetical protein
MLTILLMIMMVPFVQVLKRLDLNDSTVQSVLLACAPALEDPPSLQVISRDI